MKVSELLDVLDKMSPDAEVQVYNGAAGEAFPAVIDEEYSEEEVLILLADTPKGE